MKYMPFAISICGIMLVGGGCWWLHSGGLACVVVGALLLVDRFATEVVTFWGRRK